MQKRKCLDMSELSCVFKDLGEHVPQKELERNFANYDTDRSGYIDFDEFVLGTLQFIQSHKDSLEKSEPAVPINSQSYGLDEVIPCSDLSWKL